ncbi:MAG: ABC transporter permease [Gammaproteobacteria bacterium]|nr:ABC transporter permease [Gammaproteobacteria bacterium]MDE0283272.1 ABC transporter permease [Gammaproteobacteria bacterium]MDE0513866.1 ABC transporter permease [Gammaproteobacteria bacterium]
MIYGSTARARTAAILLANFREAADSLRKARLRTVLGLVGIMIGISSVITMVSMGEIAREQARKDFEALGTDILVARKSMEGSASGRRAILELADATALAPQTPSITDAAPRISEYGEFRYAGRDLGSGSIQGVTASFARMNRLSLQEGRFISDLDVGRYYCVIGARLAAAMRRDGPGRLTGRIMEVEGNLFTIAGVLNDTVENYALPLDVRADESVFVPITTAGRAFGKRDVDVIIARFGRGVRHETAAQDVRSFFRDRSPRLKLDVITAQELIARMEAQMRIMTLLLGTVGSISLIVGGVGIMNIMLVSVAERRREIAIRRALGARRRDIQGQFLIESVLLTVTGGALGIALGLAATWAICQFTAWEFLISGVSVVSGIGTATAVGLFFGFQPAYQASRLEPIAALHGN